MRFSAKPIALGGMLAAVAGVIMGVVGLIPVATYVSPMLCCILGYVVFRFCGKRIAWCWYLVVAAISVLIAPDKEAAIIYVFLGYYPMLKPVFERVRFASVFKLLLFNLMIVLAYALMVRLFGLEYVVEDAQFLGFIGYLVLLILGNVTFLLLDRVLTILSRKL